MAINLTKILSISFRDYVGCKEKTLLDYEPIGVHSNDGIRDNFVKLIPDNAEVVVDYHCIPPGINFMSERYGTALIPKK